MHGETTSSRHPRVSLTSCFSTPRVSPLIVLEAKSESKNPLAGKEQARKYARSQNCRFVILSNGNLHYFWDLERGNPYLITSFPTPDSVDGYKKVQPKPERLIVPPLISWTDKTHHTQAAGCSARRWRA